MTNRRRRSTCCRILLAAVGLFPGMPDGWAEGPRESGDPLPVLTNAAQVLRLGVDGALRNPHPVALTGIVTCPLPEYRWFYMQDGNAGMLVLYTNLLFQPATGQVVRVVGRVYPGQFAAHVADATVEVLRQAALPVARRADPVRMAEGDNFGGWVKIEGRVVDVFAVKGMAALCLASGSQRFLVNGRLRDSGAIPCGREPPLDWLDARVEVQGVCWTETDVWNRPAGFRIHTPGSGFVRLIEPGHTNLFEYPLVPVKSLQPGSPPGNPRVRIRGTVTHLIPGQWLFLHDETGGLRARLLPVLGRSDVNRTFRERPHQVPIRPGDQVEVVGHARRSGTAIILVDSEFRRLAGGHPILPIEVSPTTLATGNLDGWLVSVRAPVVARQTQVWGAGIEEWLRLEAGDGPIHASLRTDRTNSLPVLPRGALVQVTGICLMNRSELGASPAPQLLLRSAADVVLVRPPHPWETLAPGPILAVSGGLGLAALLWIGLLLRHVRQRRHAADRLQRALFEISEAVHDAADLTALYGRIHATIGTLMRADNFYLALLDPATGVIDFPYHRDLLDPPPSPRRGGHGMTEYVLRTGRPTLADRDEIARLKAAGDYTQTGYPSAIWLGVPLTLDGRTFGVMAVQDQHDPNAFDDEDKRLLSFVAGQTALAIERKRQQEQLQASTRRLRESEERFGKAFRSTPAVLSIMRMADERLIEVNEAFLTASGFARDEVLGHTTTELGLWVDASERAEFMRRARTAGGVRAFEARLRTKLGVEEIVLMSAEAIEINGEPCVLVLTIAVTARKRAEEELLRTLDQERELGELKSRFVSMVSHELRTPLGIILSSAEILECYLDRLTSERRREHIQDIQQATRQMAGLMEEVLLIGRAEAGRIEFHPAPLDLSACCHRIAGEVVAATQARCPVEVTVAPNLPAANADASLLRHILTNLLTNAVKYSPAGAPVRLDAAARDDGAVFTVRDRGIGIPEADARRMFQAFHRGRNVGDTPGSGLGLMIVQRCVELHRGHIDYSTREGEGTTFTVWLPVFPSGTQSNLPLPRPDTHPHPTP